VAAWGLVPIPWRRLLAIVLVALTAVVVALALARVLHHDDAPSARLVPGSGEAPGSGADTVDPLAWKADRSAAYAAAAARGLAHPLYAQSPGGALATARRVDRYRPVVESVARASGLDPDTIEAMVFLESAGRPDAAADPRLDGAVGLTQILAETGRNLLGMTVDPAGARRIGRSIRRNEGRGRDAVVARLKARRRAIDQRFDPVASLRATARYLTLAKRELGRDDLAVVSYHMGMGNLQGVLRDYGDDEVPYAQLFFDSTPLHHPAAWSRLASFGDDSSTYLWRVEAARDIMRRWREDPAALERLDVRQTAKASAEEVLHPRSSTEIFKTPGDVEHAEDDGDLVALPVRRLADAGITIDPGMGELAGRLDQERSRYRALRPEALAMLEYLGAGTQAISGTGPLIVTSTVRDTRYQRVLASENIEATHAYSLHTTGYTFDIERDYASGRQARAFQFLLDRLTALDLIAWVREPAAIHITVSARAGDALRR
jgi:soluble lytic murein transglycosylase-like protein